MMRGIIVVVVGQEPLVIHVAPDGDDIPWQSVASLRTHFRYAHKNSRTVLTRLHPACGTHQRRARGTRTFFTAPSAMRYYEFLSSASFREGRKHAFSRCSRIIGEEHQRPVFEELSTTRNFPIPNWIFGKT